MKVKVRRAGDRPAEEVAITTEFIRLDALLKFAAICQTGGEAKLLIKDGLVLFNDVVCTERGKKIRPGDTIEFDNKRFRVVSEQPK